MEVRTRLTSCSASLRPSTSSCNVLSHLGVSTILGAPFPDVYSLLRFVGTLATDLALIRLLQTIQRAQPPDPHIDRKLTIHWFQQALCRHNLSTPSHVIVRSSFSALLFTPLCALSSFGCHTLHNKSVGLQELDNKCQESPCIVSTPVQSVLVLIAPRSSCSDCTVVKIEVADIFSLRTLFHRFPWHSISQIHYHPIEYTPLSVLCAIPHFSHQRSPVAFLRIVCASAPDLSALRHLSLFSDAPASVIVQAFVHGNPSRSCHDSKVVSLLQDLQLSSTSSVHFSALSLKRLVTMHYCFVEAFPICLCRTFPHFLSCVLGFISIVSMAHLSFAVRFLFILFIFCLFHPLSLLPLPLLFISLSCCSFPVRLRHFGLVFYFICLF
jgi:hypothetical protein